MSQVQYVSSRSDIPATQRYGLVELGNENALRKTDQGFTVTVDRSLPANLLKAHTQTAIGEAQAMADQEKIDTVFVTIPKSV